MKKKPVIVFLDAGTVDYGGADMRPLSREGRLRLYHHTTKARVTVRLRDADICISNKVVLDSSNLAGLKRLKLICVAATGYNNIDITCCQKHGITVSNAVGYSSRSVAEHALMFLFGLSHRAWEHHESVIGKKWCRSLSFNLTDFCFRDLAHKTLGIVGYGNIGSEVARLARALGMKVLIAKIPGRRYGNAPARVSMKTILQKSDYVSLHCALSRDTHEIINAKTLRWMKPSACLLNLARGALVHIPSVIMALKNKKIAAYATDVLEQEPPPSKHPLFQKGLRNKVFFTPHVAWTSLESRQALIDDMAKTIALFKRGQERNRVV